MGLEIERPQASNMAIFWYQFVRFLGENPVHLEVGRLICFTVALGRSGHDVPIEKNVVDLGTKGTR